METDQIQERLNHLYQELNAAESDLHCFTGIVLDSGEENWLRDQERYIQELKQDIELLTAKL